MYLKYSLDIEEIASTRYFMNYVNSIMMIISVGKQTGLKVNRISSIIDLHLLMTSMTSILNT